MGGATNATAVSEQLRRARVVQRVPTGRNRADLSTVHRVVGPARVPASDSRLCRRVQHGRDRHGTPNERIAVGGVDDPTPIGAAVRDRIGHHGTTTTKLQQKQHKIAVTIPTDRFRTTTTAAATTATATANRTKSSTKSSLINNVCE